MRFSIALLAFLFFISSRSQNKDSYQIFDKKGKISSYKKMLQASAKTEVVLFGEYHDNSVIHWLQLELTKDLAEKSSLVLGAEMMEADNQKQLDQYLNNEISFKKLDSTARLWPNFKTDYKPLVDFAKSKNFKFIATNIPRRYASLVFKKDLRALEQLSEQEKLWIAPLPIAFDVNLPGYKSMMSMQGGHAGDKMPKAQAIKDATMAHFILKNIAINTIFVHYNGTYHSDNFEGINWYLKNQNSSIQIITVATVEQKDISKLEKEHFGKADFIIVVDEDVTKTH
jgi:uncharacterized iron-regulated protein